MGWPVIILTRALLVGTLLAVSGHFSLGFLGSNNSAKQGAGSTPGDGATPSIFDGSGADACKMAADEAVNIPANQAAPVQLITVRAMTVVKDIRSAYTAPTGAKSLVILLCHGTGVYSDDSNSPVNVSIEVDADQNLFVYFKPVTK